MYVVLCVLYNVMGTPTLYMMIKHVTIFVVYQWCVMKCKSSCYQAVCLWHLEDVAAIFYSWHMTLHATYQCVYTHARVCIHVMNALAFKNRKMYHNHFIMGGIPAVSKLYYKIHGPIPVV